MTFASPPHDSSKKEKAPDEIRGLIRITGGGGEIRTHDTGLSPTAHREAETAKAHRG